MLNKSGLAKKSEIPTQVGDLNNNVGYITADDINVSTPDWNTTDSEESSYIANKPNIKSGEGIRSVIINDSDRSRTTLSQQIYLTGDGSTTTYSYSGYVSDVVKNRVSSGTVYITRYGSEIARVTHIYPNEGTIVLDKTIGSRTNEQVRLITYASAKGADSSCIGSGNVALSNYSFAEGYMTVAIGEAQHSEGYQTYNNGAYSHAEGYQTKATNKSSHAEGYQTSASGLYSHSECDSTTASARAAHAEGERCIASATASHAEGERTTASGQYQHQEGSYTEASEAAQHQEGGLTIASGACSHAEGNEGTTASGEASHAEGNGTIAQGKYSHTEGQITKTIGLQSHAEGGNTVATNAYQHVFGLYNVKDPSSATSIYKGDYVEIVGNGTADNARSNARTLDWSGNEWLSGTLKIGGTGYNDESAKEIATKEYVDNAIAALETSLKAYVDDAIARYVQTTANMSVTGTTLNILGEE